MEALEALEVYKCYATIDRAAVTEARTVARGVLLTAAPAPPTPVTVTVMITCGVGRGRGTTN